MRESEKWKWSQSFAVAAAAAKSLQSCPTLFDPTDSSTPGSAIPGILQARTLEWVAISFSNAWKWKVKVKSLSRVRLFATPWTAAHQAPLSMGFSRQEYWSGWPLPSPEMQGTRVQFLGQEDLLEKGMATHYSNLAWRIPQTEDSGGLQSMGSQRVRHDWATITFTFFFIAFMRDTIQPIVAPLSKLSIDLLGLGYWVYLLLSEWTLITNSWKMGRTLHSSNIIMLQL